MPENYKHIFLTDTIKSEKYKASSKRGKQPLIPSRDRIIHSAKLLSQLDAIWRQNEELKQSRFAEKISTREGTYLSFTSAVGHDLVTKSLENIKKGIRLLNVKQESVQDEQVRTKATVYIPGGMEGYFISKIAKYRSEDLKSGKPKNAPLVNSIEDISVALLESLWMDIIDSIPNESSKWCETWLSVNTSENIEQEQIADFFEVLDNLEIEFKPNFILFPERAVLLIYANRNQLIELMLLSDNLAEFRIGQEPAGFWTSESSKEQQDWVEDLLSRIELIESKVAVCILDSGVNNGHQLIAPLLADNDTLAYSPIWGTYDHDPSRAGHGTLMAGISGYGNLEKSLTTNAIIQLTHKLISVKVIPPPHEEITPKELWGDVIIQSVARAEIENPDFSIVYCMAVTSKEDVKRGRPSSWSGAIDNIAFGDGESQKLIIISGGNIRDNEAFINYPEANYTTSIENPAQAWNALSVGAYTEKVIIRDTNYREYSPIAKEGELSPYSTTSLVWEKKWPFKPDIVFEGGNLMKGADNIITGHEDLELLSTSKSFNIKPFDTINATSAATAQASWFAAKLINEYPNAWPETIRGLIVHSAKWTDAMFNQLEVHIGNRKSFEKLIKVFGLGVPQIDRALYSQESALTIIAQEKIQPFSFNETNSPETNEIHFYSLPWPKELLLELGEMPVTLRITLSYFIEPGAGEIGWKDKYRYQSHGLRFEINNIGEDETAFRKRVNIAAREEDEKVDSNSGSHRWVIGANNRSNGSIHTDFWNGTAADLATCNIISVFPVIGWWRERKHLKKVENRTRYSLIISLDTPEQDIELYTTIKNIIEIPIEIKT